MELAIMLDSSKCVCSKNIGKAWLCIGPYNRQKSDDYASRLLMEKLREFGCIKSKLCKYYASYVFRVEIGGFEIHR